MCTRKRITIEGQLKARNCTCTSAVAREITFAPADPSHGLNKEWVALLVRLSVQRVNLAFAALDFYRSEQAKFERNWIRARILCGAESAKTTCTLATRCVGRTNLNN